MHPHRRIAHSRRRADLAFMAWACLFAAVAIGVAAAVYLN